VNKKERKKLLFSRKITIFAKNLQRTPNKLNLSINNEKIGTKTKHFVLDAYAHHDGQSCHRKRGLGFL
jgi:hypothetical protein